MSEIGLYIRSIRKQRGVDIMEFAKELGVSPDYLRNLESGRTQTIQLEVINKLQHEFYTLEGDSDSVIPHDPYDAASLRIDRLASSLKTLQEKDPRAADYLMRMVEQGLEWMHASGSSGTETDGQVVVRSI